MARCMQRRTAAGHREAFVAHVPDGLRHTDVAGIVPYDPALVIQREGDCFVAEVGRFDPSAADVRCHFHVGEKMVQLRPGDLVPLILAYRRSMMEFASRTAAYALGAGDTVWVLGGDGYAGSFECAEPSYGTPVPAVVLGAVPGRRGGRPLNLDDFVSPERQTASPAAGRALVVAVVGSRMDCGKSTSIRRITAGLRRRGLRVGAGKLTGFGWGPTPVWTSPTTGCLRPAARMGSACDGSRDGSSTSSDARGRTSWCSSSVRP
jgi:hypothetical protein